MEYMTPIPSAEVPPYVRGQQHMHRERKWQALMSAEAPVAPHCARKETNHNGSYHNAHYFPPSI